MGDVTSSATNNWISWEKPLTAKLIQFFCVSGGAGGGGGGAAALSAAAAGGGGGGGAPYTVLLVPAILIPSVLYIQAGSGGTGGSGEVQGGATSNNGVAGGISYISIRPNNSTSNLVCMSANAQTAAGDGALGNGGGISSGTTAIATNAGMPLSCLGVVSFSATGQAGAAAINSPVWASVGNVFSGGAGAGGVTAGNSVGAGAAVTGAGFMPTVPGGTANTIAGRARSGYDFVVNRNQEFPYASTGGSGQLGTTNSNASILPKNGGPGSGGGGGGGTNGTGFQAGPGGDGGPGFVVISWF